MAEKTVVLLVIDTGSDLAKALIARWAVPSDRSHAATRRLQRARDNFLLGRAALRALLHRHSGSRDWTILADHRGKISVVDLTDAEGPAVSLSHTGGTVACALADVESLGVDIEQHRPRALSALADYAFGQAERRLVAQAGEQAFYRIWTLREAWGKATGEGLVLAADRRDKVHDGPFLGLWGKPTDQTQWLLGHYHPLDGLSLAIAALLPVDADPGEWSVTWLDAAVLA